LEVDVATTKAPDKILELDRKYWDAVKHQDADTVAKLSADTCVVVGPQGIQEFKRDEVARMAATHQLDAYKINDRNARVLRFGDDVAVVAYEVESTMTRDGAPATTHAYDASVWVRDADGGWTCAMHAETPAA
jgi:uncharacterized protein (TIGR02246 family)